MLLKRNDLLYTLYPKTENVMSKKIWRSSIRLPAVEVQVSMIRLPQPETNVKAIYFIQLPAKGLFELLHGVFQDRENVVPEPFHVLVGEKGVPVLVAKLLP